MWLFTMNVVPAFVMSHTDATFPCENRWAIFTVHLKIIIILQGDYDTMTTSCTPIPKLWAIAHN